MASLIDAIGRKLSFVRGEDAAPSDVSNAKSKVLYIETDANDKIDSILLQDGGSDGDYLKYKN